MKTDRMNPTFEATENGLEIIDSIERCRYQLHTSNKISPISVKKDLFPHSVDSAIEITTNSITIPDSNLIYVSNWDGQMLKSISTNGRVSFPHSEYIIDISRQVKTYILVESKLQILTNDERVKICFDKDESIKLGARSFHTQPAGTITTTSEPRDIIKAVSVFGSSLKVTTPEQSFPTLRGHPPKLKIGDKLSIPEKFEQPDNGIEIKVHPRLKDIFVVTPLVYYLGAELNTGNGLKIHTKNEYQYSLGPQNKLESTVEQVLKKVFFLDCIMRTEGGWPGPLYECKEIEPDLDISSVYEQPLAKRIESYLNIPYGEIEPYLNNWKSEIHIKPSKKNIEFLPFLAYNLSTICTDHPKFDGLNNTQEKQHIREYVPNQSSVIIKQYWGSRKNPKVKSTVPLSSFYNGINQSPRTGPLDIKVICNDRKMQGELIKTYSSYGEQEGIPSNVSIHHELEKEPFIEILEQKSDFIHYIGHIDSDGFRCVDGNLCASSLETVGAKAFFLNACQSFEQGIYLVEAGSIGGIVTLDDIVNREAVHIGNTISQFLDNGHPLYVAVEAVRNDSRSGHLYQLVGDGTSIISQSEDSVSKVCTVTRDGSEFIIKLNLHQGVTKSKGSIYRPNSQIYEYYHLVPGEIIKNNISKPQLIQFLNGEKMPVVLDGKLRWSDEIKISEL